MPMQRSLYPHNWKQIADEAKSAAGQRCQRCFKKRGDWTHNRHGRPCRVVLTVAHLDHDPKNPQARLAVLCAACHIRYDTGRDQRGKKRANMQRARGQLVLFETL